MFFFFKQKTAYDMRISDWSSDVCSSDLLLEVPARHPTAEEAGTQARTALFFDQVTELLGCNFQVRVVAPHQAVAVLVDHHPAECVAVAQRPQIPVAEH